MGNRTMTEELDQLLKNLKLRRILEIYEEQLRAADKDDISYSDFVTRLVRAQWQAKQEGALEWRIRRANLPERWTLETFPFARQPGVNRKQIRGFAELEFIAKAENIVLVGDTGRGKTGLACGLLLKALENGHRCQFIKAQDLFDEMYASLADRSTRQFLKRLARLDVLLIDELGYLNLKPEQSNIFFKLMEERSPTSTIFSALVMNSSSAKPRICLRLTPGWRAKGNVSSVQRSGRLARQIGRAHV